MNLNEGIALLKHENFDLTGKQVWADLGCGSGFFTEALASLLPPESVIYAVDKIPSVSRMRSAFNTAVNAVTLHPRRLDFVSERLDFPPLNGVLMANSLHYVKDQLAFIKKMQSQLKDEHCFLIVEYDSDQSDPWVPYPVGFRTLKQLFEKAGYSSIKKLHERSPVSGFDKMYSALITTL